MKEKKHSTAELYCLKSRCLNISHRANKASAPLLWLVYQSQQFISRPNTTRTRWKDVFKHVLTERGQLSRFKRAQRPFKFGLLMRAGGASRWRCCMRACVRASMSVYVCVALLMREMQILTASRSIQTLTYTQATRGNLKETLHLFCPTLAKPEAQYLPTPADLFAI